MQKLSRRTALKSGLATSGGLLLSGCLGDIGGSGGPSELRLAHVVPESFNIHSFAVELSELVDEKTGGSVTIEVFPNAELGNASEVDSAVSSGSIAMGSTSWGSVGAQYKPISLFEWPYLFESRRHSIRGTDPETSEVLSEMNESLADEASKRILAGCHYGLRSLCIDREVTHPDDLQGLDVRAQPTPMFVSMFEGWGANPKSIAFPEIPQALSTGEIQGWDNTSFAVAAINSWEFASHWVDTRHLIQTVPFHINEGVWQGLSGDEQEALQEAATEANNIVLDETVNTEQRSVEKFLKNGMTVIANDDIDTEAFRTRADKAVKKEFPNLGEKVERVREMAR